MKLQILCFGECEIFCNGERLHWHNQSANKSRLLLKILLTKRNSFIASDLLTEIIWDEERPKKPTHALRALANRLRDLLEPHIKNWEEHQLIRTSDDGSYGLFRTDTCWIDAEEFEMLITKARNFLAKDETLTAFPLLNKAVALYRGDFLEEDRNAEWAFDQREHLQEDFIWALKHLAQAHADRKDLEKATQLAQRATSLTPGDEQLHRKLMQWYYASRSRDKAIKTYKVLQKYLLETMEVEPEDETVALYERITKKRGSRAKTLPRHTEILPEPSAKKPRVRPFNVLRIGGAGVALAVIAITAFFAWKAVSFQAPTPRPDDMIAWWDGDTLTSDLTGAKDLVGNHDGSFRGRVFQVEGKVGKGFSFAGGFTSRGNHGAYIVVPPHDDLDLLSDMTVELWAKVNELNSENDSVLVAKGSFLVSNDEPVAYMLLFRAQSGISAGFERDDMSNNFVDGPVIEDSKFHHYAYVRDDQTNYLFVDGELVAQSPVFIPPGNSRGVELVIGGAKSNSQLASTTGFCCEFNGVIDEVSVYDRALTEDEIKTIFDAGSAGKQKPN